MHTMKSKTSRGLDLAHRLSNALPAASTGYSHDQTISDNHCLGGRLSKCSLEYKPKCQISGSSTFLFLSFLVISKIDSHREDVGTLRLF